MVEFNNHDAHNSAGNRFIEQVLRLLYNTELSDAMIVLDTQGVIQGWSMGAVTVFGYETSEAVGRSISEIFTDGDKAKKIDLYELEGARQHGRSEDDRWHKRKDGAEVWVTGTLVAVRDESGELIGYVKIARDRTDMRVKIEQLERSASDANDYSLRSKTFLDTLGHEMRNPLSPLSMAVQVIERAGPTPRILQALQIIKRQFAVLEGLADDLADVASATRNSGHGLKLQVTDVNVTDLLANAVADMTPEALKKGLALLPVLQAAPIFIAGDARRLTQVVLNLIGNAIKYTPSGGEVYVKLVEEASDVVLRVEDTGMGITPEMLPQIFEFFVRGDDAAVVAPRGLGVGLGLVKQVVEAHGGTVGARSAGPDKGAEFTVRLPRRASAD